MNIDLRCGDSLDVLRTLDAESVQCAISSPPYWGLRDYGTAAWDGGDPGCDHDQRRRENDLESKSATSAGQTRDSVAGRDSCRKCGARRIDRQLGLERTPEEYVARMVGVFREVRRVMRADGVLFLNLGDSYATGAGKVGERPGGGAQGDHWQGAMTSPNRMPLPGLKPKDLCGIPWRVAFALQADGWWLRQDIIWAKPNPMPESVRDRCTKAHEYLFLLTKSARYYWDAGAMQEPAEWTGKVPDGWDQGEGAHGTIHRTGRSKGPNNGANGTTRNRRSVWTIATQPFPEAHFAVMPETLVEPCIAAGTREGDTVLDPFAGSGTVGAVAARAGRHFLGIDLNPEYVEMARRRIEAVAPLFTRTGTNEAAS